MPVTEGRFGFSLKNYSGNDISFHEHIDHILLASEIKTGNWKFVELNKIH